VEGNIGSGKRTYSLELIKARSPRSAYTSIAMAFVVMCAEKIPRLHPRFFFLSFYMPCFTPSKGHDAFGWRSGIVVGLRLEGNFSLHHRAGKLPAPHILAEITKACFWLFQGSLFGFGC
jgi:hypothetical protein